MQGLNKAAFTKRATVATPNLRSLRAQRAIGWSPSYWLGVGMFGQALRARCVVSGLRPVVGVVLPRPPAVASPLRGIGSRAGCPFPGGSLIRLGEKGACLDASGFNVALQPHP